MKPGALSAVPTLDEVASDPEKARDLPLEVAETIHARCVVVLNATLGRILAGRTEAARHAGVEEERLLTVPEAAARLATSRDWIYRHAAQLPFTVRNGRQLRFSERGLTRYIQQRRGR